MKIFLVLCFDILRGICMIWNVIFAVLLALSMIVVAPLLLVAKIMGCGGNIAAKDRYSEKVSRLWAKTIIWLTGSKVNVTGAENIPDGTPVVFISNHQSYFDILVFLAYIPGQKGFIAKIETSKVPIFSTWMKNIHCIFMDRSSLKQSFESIKKGIDNLEHGYRVVIFPEGTRSHKAEMAEFKHGSFKLATKAGVPIIPVTILDTYKIWEEKNRIRSSQVQVIISKPIETSSLSREEISELPDKVHGIISCNLSHKI
jgi:1-acyl-sn-glycerol-3-phosphate acyltransferase